MLPYVLMLLLVMFWVLIEKKSINRNSFWVPLLILSLFAGVRSSQVGTDSWKYAIDFLNTTYIDGFRFSEYKEPGYYAIKYLISRFTQNYFWLFFTVALIINSCYLRILKRYSTNYLFSILFLITLGTYAFIFNGMRQGIAMAILALALPYLLQKKLIPYLIIVSVASTFHITALSMVFFYFLTHIDIKNIYKIIISFVISLVSSSIIISYLASSNPRYEVYTEESENPGGYLTLSFYAVLALFLYFVKYLYRIKNQEFDTLLTFYSVGVVSIIPLALLGTNPSGPQRLIYYFTWILALLLPIALKNINNKLVYLGTFVLSIIFFVLTTSRFGNLTPYIINPIFEIF